MGSQEIILGWSVGKIIIILSFRVSTSKNNDTDQQVKETCATMTKLHMLLLLFWFMENIVILIKA